VAEPKVAERTQTHKPGEKVPHSGVYRVDHDRGHRVTHEITAISGRRFPPCRGCKGGVEFVLVHAAQHVEDHEDFLGLE
jgi:hypothetical protein